MIVSSDNDSDDGGGDPRWLQESFAAGATRAFIAVSLFAYFVSILASTERTDIVATNTTGWQRPRHYIEASQLVVGCGHDKDSRYPSKIAVGGKICYRRAATGQVCQQAARPPPRAG